MALPVREQLLYWSAAAVVLVVILFYLGNVLLPFVLGGAIAYCLDPIADWFERVGFSRIMATITITLIAILIFAAAFLVIVPTLISQSVALIEAAPGLFTSLRDWLVVQFPELMDSESVLREQLGAIATQLQQRGGELLNTVLNSAMSLVNVAVLVVIVPVVTFYLLLDWDRMVARVDALLPRDHAPTIRQLARDIDGTLASFIRGQGLVILIQGTYYAIGLMLVGLNFGVVVGAFAGLISFIPYVGALVGGALAIGIAIVQFWNDPIWIAVVAAIFMSGQFVEGNILTPKLVGDSVGLHPVWLLLALSVFGSLFGFIGLLVAVPLAAMIGVVARFFIAQYREGLLYRGRNPDEHETPGEDGDG